MIENKSFVRFFIGCKLGRYISQLDLTTLEAEIINMLLSESKNIEKQYNVKILIESLGNGINHHHYQSLIENILAKEKLCWGRILITLIYASYVAQRYTREESNDMVEDVINHLVHLIEDKTKTWIEDVGGWKSFLPYGKEENGIVIKGQINPENFCHET